MFSQKIFLFLAFLLIFSSVYAACGNGVVESGEACDDGNARPNDGCDASCHIETNFKGDVIWSCIGQPSVCSWIPPIGVPDVPFGINESHWMYKLGSGETCATKPEKCYNFGSGLEPYKDAGNGPYTHYVDCGGERYCWEGGCAIRCNHTCTDSGNPYGSPANPRCSIPDLAAGSVVELASEPQNSVGGNQLKIPKAEGTSAKPIFIRGASLVKISRPLKTSVG
ncbi:MAG: hypothetical protein JW772_00920, partial [Candidatus Diapherotrites archaeon]|nr:hypothetical protein [Candidatus Diapherotrites archaeon]